MSAASKHGFVVLAAAIALGTLPSSLQVSTTAAASSGWLNRLNAWRLSTGVPVLTENATWSQGDYNHAVYMVKNDLVTHYETPGTPYYTATGDAAARNGNIYVSSSTSTTDESAIDWWMQAPFHALGLMDPRLTQTGFGSYRQVKSGWQMGAAVDVLRGNSFTGGRYPVYFPGNGTTEPLRSYGGGEFPDPLQACPGYAAPTGLPVFVQVGGNVATTAGAHAFTGNGTALTHCVIDSTNPSVGSSLRTRGAVILIPRQPLVTGVHYTVALTVNGVAHNWSFTVGPLPPVNLTPCTSVSVAAVPPSTTTVGTQVTLTAGASGCPNPQYAFYLLPPGGIWTLVRPYSSTTSFAWSTAGKPVGAYLFSIWARDATSTNSYDTYQTLQYSLTVVPCGSMTATSVPPSTTKAGTQVVVTGGATGCANPLFEFWLKNPAGVWTLMRGWSSTTTFSWNTSGQPVGSYLFSVWARDANSAGTNGTAPYRYDSFSAIPYTLTPAPCTGMSASAVPATTAKVGSPVTVTGLATGCPNVRYEFWLKSPSGTWTLVRGWSSTASFTWTTTGKPAGTYLFSVWARDASSAGTGGTPPYTYDAFSAILYSLTP